jgi:hypothetical protein
VPAKQAGAGGEAVISAAVQATTKRKKAADTRKPKINVTTANPETTSRYRNPAASATKSQPR